MHPLFAQKVSSCHRAGVDGAAEKRFEIRPHCFRSNSTPLSLSLSAPTTGGWVWNDEVTKWYWRHCGTEMVRDGDDAAAADAAQWVLHFSTTTDSSTSNTDHDNAACKSTATQSPLLPGPVANGEDDQHKATRVAFVCCFYTSKSLFLFSLRVYVCMYLKLCSILLNER